jgi:predicted acylesterase/phospholipase RssA
MDNVLYFVAGPSPTALRAAESALDDVARRASTSRPPRLRIAIESSVARTLAKLRSGGADALVIDARGEASGAEESTSLSLLRALFDEHDLAGPIGRDRTWLVVGEGERAAALAFEAGRMRIAGVIAAAHDDAGWEAIWERIAETASRAHGGKVALCLAGGGIEGMFWELGVLRALEELLPSRGLCSFEIVCGISAGAVLGGLVANGLGASEIARGLRGEGGPLAPIRRRDLFDLDVPAFARRAARLSWDVVRRRRSPLSALFRLPPAGVFAGKRLRSWLERTFTADEMTDRFAKLPLQLFVGATDQDSLEHVVFDARRTPEVPVHRAIRASIALPPFYAPEVIDGRFYVDGSLTRTTNMRVAVQEGATLVILVDPLVPATSPRSGHAAERGAVFAAAQALKAMHSGRFDKAVPTLRAMYPHVAFHLFQPGEAARRVMGGSPMRYFVRAEIEEIAYRETLREIRSYRFEALARDFARHEITFQDAATRMPSAHELEDVKIVA